MLNMQDGIFWSLLAIYKVSIILQMQVHHLKAILV
jgi:hypothetical protein